jgi:hypothetical protein
VLGFRVGGQRIRWPFWIQIWQVIAEFAGHFEIEFTGNKRRYYAVTITNPKTLGSENLQCRKITLKAIPNPTLPLVIWGSEKMQCRKITRGGIPNTPEIARALNSLHEAIDTTSRRYG